MDRDRIIELGIKQMEYLSKQNSNLMPVLTFCWKNKNTSDPSKLQECITLIKNAGMAKEHSNKINQYARNILLGEN